MPIPCRRRAALLAPLTLIWSQARATESGPSLDELMARLAGVTERRANFAEHRRFAALDSVLESTGHLILRRGRLEKVTDWPQFERLEVDGDRVVLTSGNEPPRVIELSAAPELRTLIDAIRAPLLGDIAALHRAFVATTGGTLEAWTLDLVPRDPAAAKLLRSAQMRGHGQTVDRLALIQANGDEQVMVIAAP